MPEPKGPPPEIPHQPPSPDQANRDVVEFEKLEFGKLKWIMINYVMYKAKTVSVFANKQYEINASSTTKVEKNNDQEIVITLTKKDYESQQCSIAVEIKFIHSTSEIDMKFIMQDPSQQLSRALLKVFLEKITNFLQSETDIMEKNYMHIFGTVQYHLFNRTIDNLESFLLQHGYRETDEQWHIFAKTYVPQK